MPAIRLGKLRKPCLPNGTDARCNNDRMTISARVVHVLLPLLQREIASVFRPCFDREVRRDGIIAVRECAAIEIGFVRVIEKRDRDPRLIVRHEHVIHFVKRAQRSPACCEVAGDLGDHRARIGEERSLRNILIPGVVPRHDLHRRDDRVSCRRVEQRGRCHNRRRSENSPFLVDAFRASREGERRG